ncbi:unnamed protein product [Rotaria sordida]|uniref:RING-type domain-containing protein n=1 Tax=Rotaria sordida TaxID=392033 RepID=A0A814XLN7_9BILA|nr:unnamed protein product [Rotaria sordida]
MDPVYKCPACNLILNRPVQLKCGHRQCHFCRRSAETEAIICSTCHEETSVENIIIDELLIQEINELPIICPLCTWSDICTYDYFTQHENPTMNLNPNDSDNLTSLLQHSAYNNHRMDELNDDIRRLSENQPTDDLNGNVQSQETPSTNEGCPQNLESQVGITQEQCQIMKQEIDWLKTINHLLQTQLMEQPAATDGLLIWSIPDARKKIDDTLCLKELVLDSPMVITAMNGHRLQAYLYLNDHIIRTCPVDTNELNEMIGFDDFMPKNRLYQDPSRYIRDDKILIIVKVNQTNAERFAIYPPCLQNALEIIGLNDKP